MFEERYPERKIIRFRRPLFARGIFWAALFLAGLLSGMVYMGNRAIILAQKVYPEKSIAEVLGSFGQLLIAGDRPISEEDAGEINILLLGVGGNGYYGSIVTDTILVLSVRPGLEAEDETRVSLFSIPRDLAVQLPDSPEWRKINESYKRGELSAPGQGQVWAREKVEQLTGMSIPYYGVLDFDGFRKIIDAVGGVDVEVERSFTDLSFPDYNLGYLPEVKFDAGVQHLDGERALQFARSRHGNNGEGSDFARIRRQHKILQSFKDKAVSLNLVINPMQIAALLESTAEHVRTNMEPWQVKRLYDLVKEVSSDKVKTRSLDPRTGLVCSEIDAATQLYFLRLCPEKTEVDIRDFAAKRFEE